MPRRKKHMKLPNNFGSIKYLGKGRRNPYAVYPPVTEWTPTGPVTPKALGYKATWEEGYELLTVYNMEKAGKIKVSQNIYIDRSPTFAEVYKQFYDEKYLRREKQLSDASSRSTQAAFRNCSALHNKQFAQIKYDDLQAVINSCPLKHSSLELIVSLMHQIYRYALKYEIVDKDYSCFLYIPKADDDESGEPFTDFELKILWENRTDPDVQMILIMCYSGYRIKAFEDIEVNLSEKYFKGGVKTNAGKKRVVPIHSGIYDIVSSRYTSSNLLGCAAPTFRKHMYNKLEALGILYTADGKKHTPHDCRHTFSYLCEKYGVNENDRKRMLGHSFGNDITNATYGHRTLESLQQEIEKIKLPICY